MSGWNKQVDNLGVHVYLRACAFVIIVIGFVTGHTLLFLLGSMYFLYFLVSYFYLNRVGEKLQFTIVEEKMKLFPGDAGVLKIKIKQPSRLPIYIGRVYFVVDNNIHFVNGDERTRISQINIPFSLLGRSEVVIEVPFIAKARGVARLHQVELQITHFLDGGKLYLHKSDVTKFEALIYSEQKHVHGLTRIFPRKQGAFPTRASIYEDNTNIVGTRDYVNGDSFNKIHWKATARMNSLQTKQHEKTLQFSWLIVLDVRSGNLEDRIKGISFLLHYAMKHQIPFSLLINIKKKGAPSYLELPFGSGKRHLQTALTILARIQGNSITVGMKSLERIVYQHAVNSPYVIICADSDRLNGWKLPTHTSVYILDGYNQLIHWKEVANG
ncbi:DUF58 domain-containing protein [Sutcliffiella rhizosphaerae]|uniref:DUF58 domain-containing protein n=1 Tax=Sutcliffiella rhizosphaerae TaxID=2880967 RepID=A0ABN8A9P4_9BACI|nr:DUF58 domain-containing protein [Sutcliffiella rhizosphaerae]CAG9621860.1 hypothetical protein BACCIP111883_02651 [Sutcliffiella rhizosphaerae]